MNKATMAFTHGDYEVRLAFFPDAYDFYFRVYVPAEYDQDYSERRGNFDVTGAPELASELASIAALPSGPPSAATAAKSYFDRCYGG